MNLAWLEHWVPLRLYARDRRVMVDWMHLGGDRFTDPFFEQTVARCLRSPAGVLFRHQTPVETLRELEAQRPGLKPDGFIFHLSRCGSTLVAQMLAALPENIVISEAGPVDFALRGQSPGAVVTDEERITWLRGVVSALGRPREAREKHYFIKFDAWHVLQWPLLRRAFPAVPWIFLQRDPVEVMVSHRREPGGQTVPGVLDPRLFGLDAGSVGTIPPDEYCARVLGKILESALAHAGDERVLIINYAQLPDVVVPGVLDFFRVAYPAAGLERIKNAARLNAKSPSFPFEPDSAEKQREAGDRLRQLADQWVRPSYERLEAVRLERATR